MALRCSTGKIVYSTPQRARRALEAQRKKLHRRQLFQYRCPACRFWHLTHIKSDLGEHRLDE